MKKNQRLLGSELRKIDSKLRMIANGNDEVNAIRAEQSSAISVARDVKIPSRQATAAVQELITKTPLRGKLNALSEDVRVNVFIARSRGDLPARREGALQSPVNRWDTATIGLRDVAALARNPDVLYVSIGQSLAKPITSTGMDVPAKPTPRTTLLGKAAKHTGKKVLVGIVDVDGFDFAHPDFLDAHGETRFRFIWDQGANASPAETTPYGYGKIITKEEMDRAIASATGVGVPATELEPQSQMQPGSHGTHVASIAAGNNGIAPEAAIAAVLVSLPENDYERRSSFYDSTRLAHAIEWLTRLADELNVPISINVSLGTNGHAHDTSAPLNRLVDAYLTEPGRSVCVAAGNAGQERAETPSDWGYVMGRIHTKGRLSSAGLEHDIEWVVVGNTIVDVSENELELWFSSQDRIEVTVRAPTGETIGPVRPREFVENRQLTGGSFVSVYNELYHPATGGNYVGIYLSPYLSRTRVVGVPAGVWIVRLRALEIRDGRFDGWIERDDPQPQGEVAPNREAWSFPSYFGDRSNVDESSISSLACALRVIAVANLEEMTERINTSSSQGPTRDGRAKPEIAARGTDVVAANGFVGTEQPWVSMTGTSMASPFVAGVVALMLAEQPKLTAAQILGILQRTAAPLPGHDFSWRNDAGFGRIDPAGALAEASALLEREDKTDEN